MPINVITVIKCNRPRAVVADFASDPDHAMTRYRKIKSVEWKSHKPMVVGSQAAFAAQVLGRTLTYTYEVERFVPNERFVQSTAEGRFTMASESAWEDTAAGGTTMTLRNPGDPTGFAKMVAPVMAREMWRVNLKHLKQLKKILETSNPSNP